MSDGGFETDKMVKNKKTRLFGNVKNPFTGVYTSYPSVSNDKEDVYVNSSVDINPIHGVVNGEDCSSNIYMSQDDIDSMITKLRAISGRPFGEANPVLDMKDYIQNQKISNNHESIILSNARQEISKKKNSSIKKESSKKKNSIENFTSINIAGKIQEASETYRCIDCSKREKCKLDAQGSLDLCKR
jgi:hypothetical protein